MALGPRSRLTPHIAPLALLAALALAYFAPLALEPRQVLYSERSDFLSMHLPAKELLIARLRADGELPLWNPCTFAGQPFVHDIQVSAFYPPHAVLYLVPQESIGMALSWLVFGHVLAAGWCAYVYAIGRGLLPWHAFVAGLGFMFAGKWLLHVLELGHYNMIPLAWLPLLLFFLEEGIRRRSLLWAMASGCVFALVVLAAYPYITLYVGMFTAVWSLGVAFEEQADRAPVSRRALLLTWAGMGLCCAVVGAALGAVQLLPAVEAASHATRNLGVPSGDLLRGGVESMVNLTGRGAVTPQIEYEGGLGVLWLALAVLAGVWLPGRARFDGAAALMVLFYVLVGAWLVQGLPGFRYFRVPSRALLLLPFPISFLAAHALQALCGARPIPTIAVAQPRHVLLKVLFALAILQGAYAVARVFQGHPYQIHMYWQILPAVAALAWWLLGKTGDAATGGRGPSFVFPLLVLLLLVDTVALTGRLVRVMPWAEASRPSECVNGVIVRTGGGFGNARIVTRNPPMSFSSRTPLWPNQQETLSLESVGGFNPTDVRRFKEYVQMISGVDEPLRPPQGPFTFPVLETFPVKHKKLLDLLGVYYVLQPQWIDPDKRVPYVVPGERDLSGDQRWRVAGTDPQPRAFDFMQGGLVDLPPYILYENTEALPRAFVVGEARPLPARPELMPALAEADFTRTVFLEDLEGVAERGGKAAGDRLTTIVDDVPNQVTIEVLAGPAGYLVLADVWFPGWECTVNGSPVPIQRANYLFRAVEIPAERCDVVFRFSPRSYLLGQAVSLLMLTIVFVGMLAGWVRRSR